MAPVIRAKCIICTDQFWGVKDICALPCGHTFHWNCSARWIKTNKSCPNCRQKVQERNIVPQLFFEECTDDTIIESDANNPVLEAKIEQLSEALQKAKNETFEAKDEARKTREEFDSLNDKLARSEKKLVKLPQIQSENRHLHNLLEDQKALRRELSQKDALLKASEFFKMFSGNEERADEAMAKYIDANGCPDASKFLSVTKKQLHDSQRKAALFSADVQKLQKEKQSLLKSNHDLVNLVKALKDECDQLRANQEMNTPYNRKLKAIFDKAPPPRLSLGFNETLDINVDVFDQAMEKAAAPKPLNHMRNVASSSKSDTTIDLFTPPGPSRNAGSKVYPCTNFVESEFNDSELFDSSDLRLPEALKQRVLSREPIKKSNAMGGIPKSTFIKEDDLCFDRSPTIRPRPIKTLLLEKRKNLERQPLKKTISSDNVKMVTISSFFESSKPKARLPLENLKNNDSVINLD